MHKTKFYFYLICFFLSIFSSGIFASSLHPETVVIDKNTEDIILKGSELSIFADTSKSMTIDQVASPENASKFIVNSKEVADIENINSVYWVRFKIRKELASTQHWVLENLDPHIDQFNFYRQVSEKKFVEKKAGYSVPFAVREYAHKNFIFDLPVDTIEKTFYVRAESKNHNPFLFKIRSQNFFTYYALNEYYLLGIFYGIIAIMAIYNLLIYFSVREELYLYYVLYVISCGIISLAEDGTGFQYLWPDRPWLNNTLALISPLLLLISFSVYSKSFLQLKKNLPRMDKILDVVIVFFIIFFFADKFLLDLKLNIPIYLIPFSIIYIAAFLCLQKGFKAARYYIVGYSFMFMSILFLFIRMSGLVHWSDIFTVYSFNIGIVFEIVILSFALGDRIKLIKMEKESALESMIIHLKENERLKDNLNQELEGKVQERTVALKATNDQLQESLQKLEFQAEEIKRMNELLGIENKNLEVNVKELTKARVLMREVDFGEFNNIFPDKESCYKYLSELKWKNGYKCKKCGHEKYCDGKDIFSRRCTRCRYDESPTAYTIFHRLKFPITKAFYMLFLVYANKEKITSLELSQILELRQSTCWGFNNKILDAMKTRKKGMSSNEADGWSLLVLDPNEKG